MAYQTWIADALRAHGLDVREVSGWRTRGSSHFAPQGVVVHHTASSSSGGSAPSLNVVIHGRSDLSGPLCHVLIGREGECYVIAAGCANHAGSGGFRGLTGNTSVLGIEAENDGRGEPWPAHQLDVFYRASAALASGINHDASWVCGHKEWTSRKIDPHPLDMDAFRRSVAAAMNPRRYQMLVYAKHGTPDAAAVLYANGYVAPIPGVFTTDVNEARSAVKRGERVVAVGGPAARDVPRAEAVVGADRADSARKVIDLAARGWAA